MRAIYECADDSPTRRLRLDLLAKHVHDRLDLVGIEAAAREKCVQPPPSSEVVKSSERLPFLFRHSTHGCLGIHAVTVANFVECLVRELAATPRRASSCTMRRRDEPAARSLVRANCRAKSASSKYFCCCSRARAASTSAAGSPFRRSWRRNSVTERARKPSSLSARSYVAEEPGSDPPSPWEFPGPSALRVPLPGSMEPDP